MTATVTLPYEEYQALQTRLEALERENLRLTKDTWALEARVQTLQAENASTTGTIMRTGTIPPGELRVFMPGKIQGQPVSVSNWTDEWPDRRVRKHT